MKIALSIMVVLSALFFLSCNKAKSGPYTAKLAGDYLIVGRAGGFTATINTSYYLIANEELRKDTGVNSGRPPEDAGAFNFNMLLAQPAYTAVAAMPKMIPAELLDHNNETIGTVFIDAGYTDIRTKINGVTYRWKFEANLTGVSTEITNFLDTVQNVFRY